MVELIKWLALLLWVEYSYTTLEHSIMITTPFEIVYGSPLSTLLSNDSQIANNKDMENFL